jgi:hypothetical protein
MSTTQSEAASSPGSRRAEANRLNAQKSTGPKTLAGRSRSSRNSTRHALLAKTATLMARPTQELQTLLGKFNADLRPASVQEEVLVEEMAASAWRMKQSSRIEASLMAIQMQQTYQSVLNAGTPAEWHLPTPFADVRGVVHEPEEPESPHVADASDEIQTVMLGAAWAEEPATFALLRYHAQARRDYFRALKHLEALRTGQAGYLPQDPPPATAKPIEPNPAPEPEPAECETNPTPETKPAAAASAKFETNPTAAPSSRESARPCSSSTLSYEKRIEICSPSSNNSEGVQS